MTEKTGQNHVDPKPPLPCDGQGRLVFRDGAALLCPPSPTRAKAPVPLVSLISPGTELRSLVASAEVGRETDFYDPDKRPGYMTLLDTGADGLSFTPSRMGPVLSPTDFGVCRSRKKPLVPSLPLRVFS